MSKIKLMDFSSEWCVPCQKQSPIIDKLSDEYKEVDFEEIDIEENNEKANEYNVSAIPTIIIESDDEVKEKFVGFTEKQDLEKALDKIIKN